MNEKITLILTHPLFQNSLSLIDEKEKSRIYCKHDLPHLLEVARIGYIIALEENLPYSRELIYAAALMHDLGRSMDCADHAQASVSIAKKILPACQFSAEECETIYHAIIKHRQSPHEHNLAYILYTADKKSRLCFLCDAQQTCYWSMDKRNYHLWR